MTTGAVFVRQMDRLKTTFTERAYPRERIEMIWMEVKNLNDSDFIILVDNLIADSRFAPTRKEFRIAISELRFEKHSEEKKKISAQLKSVGPEDSAQGLKFVGKILAGKYTNMQIETFSKAVKSRQSACQFCDGSGYVFTKEKSGAYENIVFKCNCLFGKEIEEKIPVWSALFSEKYALMN
jgi:hypothetical protein